MTRAKAGDTVKIHYKGSLDDGSVFESTEGREPLEFRIGEGNIITGIEEAVIGMAPDEVKTATISPEKGFGEYREEMVVEVNRSQFPGHIDPTPGQQLELKQSDGQAFIVTVTGVEGETVKLDANHPLAGKDLTFQIELKQIK